MKRLVASVCIALIIPALAWLAGFDFNERGVSALFTAVGASFTFVAAYSYPFWPKGW